MDFYLWCSYTYGRISPVRQCFQKTKVIFWTELLLHTRTHRMYHWLDRARHCIKLQRHDYHSWRGSVQLPKWSWTYSSCVSLSTARSCSINRTGALMSAVILCGGYLHDIVDHRMQRVQVDNTIVKYPERSSSWIPNKSSRLYTPMTYFAYWDVVVLATICALMTCRPSTWHGSVTGLVLCSDHRQRPVLCAYLPASA